LISEELFLGRTVLGKNCSWEELFLGRIVWGRIDPGRTDSETTFTVV
jgi:hypothetical protein